MGPDGKLLKYVSPLSELNPPGSADDALMAFQVGEKCTAAMLRHAAFHCRDVAWFTGCSVAWFTGCFADGVSGLFRRVQHRMCISGDADRVAWPKPTGYKKEVRSTSGSLMVILM